MGGAKAAAAVAAATTRRPACQPPHNFQQPCQSRAPGQAGQATRGHPRWSSERHVPSNHSPFIMDIIIGDGKFHRRRPLVLALFGKRKGEQPQEDGSETEEQEHEEAMTEIHMPACCTAQSVFYVELA